ncbi:PQQ-binding-like beta-propeller repeat protein [Hellea sp.]|jgi:outer membrane protein assembly factor BamB|nr:PQQ-binding-like beta-propeller repeat protein [Hellea sp.]
MKIKLMKYYFSIISVLILTSCSTISGIGDAVGSINPFDRSDEKSKAAQGKVAGETDRISILELNETLKESENIKPEQIVLPPAYSNVSWPQVGGNAAHALQHTDAKGSFRKLWSKSTGKGSNRKGRVVAPPVTDGGYIYTMDGNNLITAMDVISGNKLWKYKVALTERQRTRKGRVGVIERVRDPLSLLDGSGTDKESVGGGIAVENGKLFVTSGLGVVSGLDSKTGEEIWRTVTRTPMHSAPTSAGGRVFAVSDDNELFAFNAETGEVIWTYQGIVESARMLTAPSPAVVGDTVISGFASGELIALRVQNGSVLWQDALSSAGQLTPLASLNDIASGPVVDDGYVIASAQSGVTSAFDLRTGQRIWTQPAGSLNFPLLAGDFVYLAMTDGRIICMSKTDGSVIWIKQLRSHKNIKKKKKRISYSGPIFVGERLMVMSSRGKAITLNPYDGTIIDEFKIGGNVFIAPVIANETVFVMTNSAKLIAFR